MKFDCNDHIVCEWPNCNIVAVHHIYYEIEDIIVCSVHRGATMINIENEGKIWIFKDKKRKQQEEEEKVIRPGEKAPVHAKDMVESSDTERWEQRAAKQAAARAVPVVQISNLPQPKLRSAQGEPLSQGPKRQLRPGE